MTTPSIPAPDPAYLAQIEALPLRPSRCTACKEDRTCVAIGPEWDGDAVEKMPPPRFGCPVCQVALGQCFDEGYPEDDTYKSGLYTAVLRSPLDPFFAWVPEAMREAMARFGFGVVQNSHHVSNLRTLIVRGTVWVSEETRIFVDLGLPALEIDAVEKTIGLPEDYRAKYRLPGEQIETRVLTNLGPAVPVTLPSALGLIDPRWDRGYGAVGGAILPLRQIRLIEAIHGEVTWHVLSPKLPVVACRGGSPCAVLMPLNVTKIEVLWKEERAEDKASRAAWTNNAEAFVAALDPTPFGMGALHVSFFVEEDDPEVMHLDLCDGTKRVEVEMGTDWRYPWVGAEGEKLGSGGKITRALAEAHASTEAPLPPCDRCAPTGETIPTL